MHDLLLTTLTLCAILLLPVGTVLAQPDAAFEALRDAESFAPGGVSIDNHRSEPLFALDELAAQGTPELERLFREANTIEGKLYALLGLYSLDRARHDVLSRQLPPGARVRMESGCMRFGVDVREALSNIAGPLTMFPQRN